MLTVPRRKTAVGGWRFSLAAPRVLEQFFTRT